MGQASPVRIYFEDYQPELISKKDSLICRIAMPPVTDMIELFLDLHPYLADATDLYGRK